jgi:viroplasmin and RNaseH domain-containing protein
MKQLFLTAVVAIVLGASAFADPTSINYNVRTHFSADFREAENVTWKIENNFAKASFVYNDEKMEAFYNNDGDLMATSKAFAFNKLPKAARKTISEKYAGLDVQECIEMVTSDGEKNYYVSLKKDGQPLVLQVNTFGAVSLFQ